MTKPRPHAILFFLIILSFLFFALSIAYGPVDIPFSTILKTLFGQEMAGTSWQIIHLARLPRSIAALLSGMALSASGVILQATLQNPLAAPSLMGVNAGAGLAAMLLIAFFPTAYYLLPPVAFLGALGALFLTTIIAGTSGGSKASLLLSGVAVSALLGAALDTIRTLKPDAIISASSFMIGGFSGVSWPIINFVLPWLTLAIIITTLTGPILNILSLGDNTASSLGLNLKRTRILLMILAAVLAGGAVCLAGLLGFVGMIVPHTMRMLFGHDHRWLVPSTILWGGCFVLICDLCSRILFAPYEIPVGIILAFCGAPFFIFLIFQNRNMHEI